MGKTPGETFQHSLFLFFVYYRIRSKRNARAHVAPDGRRQAGAAKLLDLCAGICGEKPCLGRRNAVILAAPQSIADYSGMNTVAEEAGFIVAYPQGTVDQQGNAFFNVGYAFHRAAVDDVDFVRRMIAKLGAEHAINSQEIFATGV